MAKRTRRSAAVHGVVGEPRGRLLTELCGSPHTAAELARSVGTSSNAVRVHLEALRSSGLVEYEVARRGVGKPTHVYQLTSAGEHLLSSAYSPTLAAFLDAVRLRTNGEFTSLLRDAGTILARRYLETLPASAHGLNAAAAVFAALGAEVVVKARGEDRTISGLCCPLAAISRTTPEVCQMMEEALSSVSGLSMRERCDRGPHPRCAFVVTS